ncbi:NTP transferase domain-containing protein [Microbulbifer elongatus]|uniref:nucleotidyltransferase family protein n=1 Tax=Microbulbifer elongatus TaxID=86173 RepID=UPI001CFC53A8|nr:nucleotidyltransferase family protein [Microbulbifer elongatus]
MSAVNENFATVILAAGAARRFGDCKHLLDQGGQSVLQRRVEAVREAGLPTPLIITGAWHEDIRHAHPDLLLHHHQGWEQGLGTSIAFAMGCLPENTQAVLLLLGDQIAVNSADIRQLYRHWQQSKALTCALYHGAPGVPAIFPRPLFSELRALEGDRGAKTLLVQYAKPANTIPMNSAAIDIDTPDDWLRWQNSNNEFSNGEALWN